MVTIRSAKNKGAQFEYSVYDSLKPLYHDLVLTKQLGFVSQHDIESKGANMRIECKRHKHFDWNELVKLFLKLEKNHSPSGEAFLIFQANRQPCLVMFRLVAHLHVMDFEGYFGINFIKHTGKKND